MKRIALFIAKLFSFSVPNLIKGCLCLWDVLLGWLIGLVMMQRFGMTCRTAGILLLLALLLVIRSKRVIARKSGKVILPLPTVSSIRLLAIFALIGFSVMLLVHCIFNVL